MKLLRDYTPFYLGCEVLAYTTFKDEDTGQEVTIELDKAILGVGIDGEVRLSGTIKAQTFKFKLRPLSSMTEEEKREFFKVDGTYTLSELDPEDEDIKTTENIIRGGEYQPHTFVWLLSKYFDLFNLIPDGLAIDRTKLNSELSDERSVESKDSQRTNAD